MEFVLRTRQQVWKLVTWAGPLHSRIPEFTLVPRAWGQVGAQHPLGVHLIPTEMVREANNSPGDDHLERQGVPHAILGAIAGAETGVG